MPIQTIPATISKTEPLHTDTMNKIGFFLFRFQSVSNKLVKLLTKREIKTKQKI